jgi:hypothetical protein
LDIDTHLKRLEQQLAAFEILHREELETFEKKLAIYRGLQAQEVKMLQEEIEKLRAAIGTLEKPPSTTPSGPTITP